MILTGPSPAFVLLTVAAVPGTIWCAWHRHGTARARDPRTLPGIADRSVQITGDIYGHVATEGARAAMDRLAQALSW